jgi:hypothetical protein
MNQALVSPVYVIAGFLGSGKTIVLKRALAHELNRGVKERSSNRPISSSSGRRVPWERCLKGSAACLVRLPRRTTRWSRARRRKS